ncbi:hypothetical protein [Persicobacter psychrovividus]|uniref:Transglutaminase-like domain-containing protein n=1 Tax=Persicobacter psychrovividus TaxID=387638 RepID=A0ABM7VIF3_9BACT|nr:hypothetical protein PEPS_30090 [Persicobacter psychrovividus]
MNEDLANIAKVAAVGTVVAGGLYFYKKGKKILPVADLKFTYHLPRLHSVDLQKVVIAVDIQAYNPRTTAVALGLRQIVANYNGAPLAFSVPQGKVHEIAPTSTQVLPIKFEIPLSNLLGKGLKISQVSTILSSLAFDLHLTVNGEQVNHHLASEAMSGFSGELRQLGITSGPRNVADGRAYNHLIKSVENKDILLKHGNVFDTVNACIQIVERHYLEVADLAKKLKVANTRNTAKNIFDFAYKHLQYKLDEAGTEQLRTPARSWLDGQIRFKQRNEKDAGIDCDDFSIFCGSLLKCLGIPFEFRITKYNGKRNFQHIYIFIPDDQDASGEIIIDPVLDRFDYQVPYSYEQSFPMTNSNVSVSSLGLPIYALSGHSGGSTADELELENIISGIDFDDTIGTISDEDKTYNYLVRTRDFISKNQDNASKIAHIQNPVQFLDMLNQAIKYWHTPKRGPILDKLELLEEKLMDADFIQSDLLGIEDYLDAEDQELDGLGLFRRRRGKKRRRGRFFSALKKIGKKIGKFAKKAVKAVVRFNPVSIAVRNGLLLAFRTNMFGLAKKMQYAYLPDNMASRHNIDPAKLRQIKAAFARVKKIFSKLQGKSHNLKKAIIKGAKQKSRDFSLSGFGDVEFYDDEFGGFGAVATAASVAAATPVLAKIGSFFKPIKDIFKKVKSKVRNIFPKRKKSTASKPVLTPTRTTSRSTTANQRTMPATTSYQNPTTTNSSVPAVPATQSKLPIKKILIGTGILAAVGGGIFAATKYMKKDDLGGIVLA